MNAREGLLILLIYIPDLQDVLKLFVFVFVFTKLSFCLNFHYPWGVTYKKSQSQTKKKQLLLTFVSLKISRSIWFVSTKYICKYLLSYHSYTLVLED